MPKKNSRDNNPLNPYVKYSGMTAQMVFIIAGGSFGAYKLDKWIDVTFPFLTIIISLVSVFLAIWLFIREFNKTNGK